MEGWSTHFLWLFWTLSYMKWSLLTKTSQKKTVHWVKRSKDDWKVLCRTTVWKMDCPWEASVWVLTTLNNHCCLSLSRDDQPQPMNVSLNYPLCPFRTSEAIRSKIVWTKNYSWQIPTGLRLSANLTIIVPKGSQVPVLSPSLGRCLRILS